MEAQSQWPALWEGRELEKRGAQEGREEREWVERMGHDGFLKGPGGGGHVGKLGGLLGEYEEERGAERVRMLRRERAARAAFVPEEDSDSDEEDMGKEEEEKPEEAKVLFERLVKEHFIYGLLDVSLSIWFDITPVSYWYCAASRL